MGADNGDFSEWRRLILHELESLDSSYKNLQKEMHEMNIRLVKTQTTLKIRSGMWGAIGAVIPVIGAVLFIVVKGI